MTCGTGDPRDGCGAWDPCELGRVMDHRGHGWCIVPGQFHQGCWLGVGWVRHPQMPPPWVGEAPGTCSAPCSGMAMAFPGKVSPRWALWWGVHTPKPMCRCACSHTAHVYTPATCTLKPPCTHVHFPGTPQGMCSENPARRQPPTASLWGHPPPSPHPLGSRSPCSPCVSFSHPGSRTLSHVPTPVPVDSSSRQRLAG